MADGNVSPEPVEVESVSVFEVLPCPGNVQQVSMSPAEMMRFFDKVSAFASPRGCWAWTGSLDKWGYALLRINGKTRVAHKAIYEEIPQLRRIGPELRFDMDEIAKWMRRREDGGES